MVATRSPPNELTSTMYNTLVSYQKELRALAKGCDQVSQTAPQAALPLSCPCLLGSFGDFDQVGCRLRKPGSVRCCRRLMQSPDSSDPLLGQDRPGEFISFYVR